MSEKSEVSKVTLCVQIRKWLWLSRLLSKGRYRAARTILPVKCLRVYKSGQWSTICHFRQPYCTSIRIQYNSRFILLYLQLKYNQTKMCRQWEWQYFKIFKIRFSHLNQFVFPCSEQKADHLRKDNYNLCSFYFSTAFTIYCHNLFSQFMQLLFFQPSQEEKMCGLLWSVEY